MGTTELHLPHGEGEIVVDLHTETRVLFHLFFTIRAWTRVSLVGRGLCPIGMKIAILSGRPLDDLLIDRAAEPLLALSPERAAVVAVDGQALDEDDGRDVVTVLVAHWGHGEDALRSLLDQATPPLEAFAAELQRWNGASDQS
jgi:hypothetical protein